MRSLAVLLALCLSACGGSAGSSSSEPLALLGAGPADTWHLLPASYLDELAARGLGLTVTEDRPTVQALDWTKGQLPARFPEEARAWNERACELGVIQIVFWLNWNVLPVRAQSDQWAEEEFGKFLDSYDPACTWLEPVAEPDEGDTGKARRWTKMAADRWPGKLVLPAAGAGWSEIRRDFVDFHPAGARDASERLGQFPPGWLVITDGGDFLFPPSVFGEVEALSRKSLGTGIPLVFYTDRWAPGDLGQHLGLLDLVGKALK